MIDVKVRNGCIEVTGHARHGPPGQDIVCAGATTLTQTLIYSIEKLTEDVISCKVESGNVKIRYKNLSEKSKTLVDSFFIGMCALAEEFPENIRIV